MSIKDSGLVRYLNKHFNGDDVFTIQQKCERFVGNNVVNNRYDQLIKTREKVFMQYFKNNGTDGRVKLTAYQNSVPFNGFSYFKLKYSGDIPKDLAEAYEKLDELNEEAPRDKYLKERKKTKSTSPIPVP